MTYTNLVGDKEEPSVKFIWTPLRAWKQRPGGTVMESREDVRAYFEGQTAASPWDQMQLLYFVSQALWRHTCAPFYLTWPGFEIREAGIEPVEHDQATPITRIYTFAGLYGHLHPLFDCKEGSGFATRRRPGREAREHAHHPCPADVGRGEPQDAFPRISWCDSQPVLRSGE